MAARITFQEIEALVEGNAAVRLTAQEIEVLTQGNAVARITAQEIEVLLSPWVRSASDTLNNWFDAAVTDYLVYAGNYPISVGDQLQFNDGYVITFNPSSIQVAVNSLNANNFDAAVIGIGLIFSDDANNLSDGVTRTVAIAEVFDSAFYGLADALSTHYIGVNPITGTDTLTLSDAASIVLYSSQNPGDSFSLSDSIALRFNYNPVFSDTLSISDASVLTLAFLVSTSDNLNNLSDAAVTAFTTGTSNASADTMNNLSDAASTLLNTSLTNYLRRYLNDVVN